MLNYFVVIKILYLSIKFLFYGDKKLLIYIFTLAQIQLNFFKVIFIRMGKIVLYRIYNFHKKIYLLFF